MAYKSGIVTLGSMLVCLSIVAFDSSREVSGLTYNVEARAITSAPAMLTLLRQNLARGYPRAQRCQRYAAVLNEFLTTGQLTQFQVLDWAIADQAIISRVYGQMNVYRLREVYVDGISSFFHDTVDKSMLELVDCLSDNFRQHDVKARVFLGKPELQTIIRQYYSIMEQPLSFVLDDEARHPELSEKELTEPVRKLVHDIFGYNLAAVHSHFGGKPTETPSPPQELTSEPNLEAPSTPAPVQKSKSEPVLSSEQKPAPGQSEKKTDAAPSEPAPAPAEEELAKRAGFLKSLYESFPEDTRLEERCKAYGRALMAKPKQLNEKFLPQTLERIKLLIAERPADKPEVQYMPAPTARTTFLVTFISLDPTLVGLEAYLDASGCIAQWQATDEVASEFINSPENIAVINQLAAQSGATKH